MPTYAFKCRHCGKGDERVMSIRQYMATPPRIPCCGESMARDFSADAGLMMVSDAHYAGLRAPDGTDISSRAKHRAYMKANNLTTVDDFASTWRRDSAERIARMAGVDPQRVHDVVNAVKKLGG